MAIFNCKIPISHICENERLERVETLQSSAEKTINVISPGQLFADRERRPGLFADQNGKAGGVAFSQLFPNSFRFCVAVFDSRHLTMSCCTERNAQKTRRGNPREFACENGKSSRDTNSDGDDVTPFHVHVRT